MKLREQILLLSLDEKKGAFHNPQTVPHVVAGALLMELDVLGRVALEDGFLVPVAGEPTGDPLLDELLGIMGQAGRRKRAPAWVRVVPAKLKKVHDRVARDLVQRGILRESEDKVLWVFPVKRYPERRRGPEREIRDLVHRVASGSRRIDPHSGRLAALVSAARLARHVFAPHHRKESGRRLDELVKSAAFGRIVGETAREIHVAVKKTVEAARGG